MTDIAHYAVLPRNVRMRARRPMRRSDRDTAVAQYFKIEMFRCHASPRSPMGDLRHRLRECVRIFQRIRNCRWPRTERRASPPTSHLPRLPTVRCRCIPTLIRTTLHTTYASVRRCVLARESTGRRRPPGNAPKSDYKRLQDPSIQISQLASNMSRQAMRIGRRWRCGARWPCRRSLRIALVVFLESMMTTSGTNTALARRS
ncbi:hypothetical protein PMO31116_02093 [Pandoraea morbifera]|uniref:Uncharacterized protein n=1 Tax=Pandoraea morbifera TaxID=2508300 RepID=A0A5E4UPA4_9BURK|nr:hypothetical protein PMO31116_02093 [Pandoraea morbifera]